MGANVEETLREVSERLVRIETSLEQLKKREDRYVSRLEFEPVKRIVYGMVGLILTSVVGALLGLILLQ